VELVTEAVAERAVRFVWVLLVFASPPARSPAAVRTRELDHRLSLRGFNELRVFPDAGGLTALAYCRCRDLRSEPLLESGPSGADQPGVSLRVVFLHRRGHRRRGFTRRAERDGRLAKSVGLGRRHADPYAGWVPDPIKREVTAIRTRCRYGTRAA